MGSHQLQSLIKMANQIADNNTHTGTSDDVASLVTNHIQKFWSRGMKQQIIEYQSNGGESLNPIASKAVNNLT